jgi:hypothetical protein
LKRVLGIILVLLPLSQFAQDIADEYMSAYVVVVDTSTDYGTLRTKMFSLSKAIGIKIDTMGRGFNGTKNLIALPEDDSDEIYAGDYFPRRYPNEKLSLEYLVFYNQNDSTTPNLIALVSLITDIEQRAREHLDSIKTIEPKAFIVNSEIYMGCMH